DVDEIASLLTDRTRLVILNSPQNPTGGVMPKEDVAALVEVLRKWPQVIVLSDEIYSDVLYEGEHTSVLRHPGMAERTILLDGFSKTYAMTGWPLGYGVMPVALVDQLARLQTNSASCTATFTQMAGVAALRGDHGPIRAMIEAFRKRRDVIVDGLNAIKGFRC